MGRSADWDSFGLAWPSRSNPATCLLLSRYKRGYAKDMKELGYQPCSAYPLEEATYRQLLDELHSLASSQQDPLQTCTTWRDGCSIANLWDTALRGHDSGILRVSSVKDTEGRPVLPFTKPPSPGRYLVYPWSTKVNQTDPCDPIPVEYPRWELRPAPPSLSACICAQPLSSTCNAFTGCLTPHIAHMHLSPCSDQAEQRYSFIYWLWQLQQASQALQQPLSDFLFRPTDGPVFAERPLTSAAIHDRFVSSLQRFGLYKGKWQLMWHASPPPCHPIQGLPSSFTHPLLSALASASLQARPHTGCGVAPCRTTPEQVWSSLPSRSGHRSRPTASYACTSTLQPTCVAARARNASWTRVAATVATAAMLSDLA